MLNVRGDRITVMSSSKHLIVSKKTCPLSSLEESMRAGLGRLLGVCGGIDSDLAFQQTSGVCNETCPYIRNMQSPFVNLLGCNSEN